MNEPVMTWLRGWLTEQFEQRKVERNSSLGQAIKYLRNRWEKLTSFVRIPGDVYMSLIHTCYFAEADPIDLFDGAAEERVTGPGRSEPVIAMELP